MPILQEIVQKAEDFDMSVVLLRYQNDTRLPHSVVKEHEREIKRFLGMCAHSPGRYGMRGPLDDLWHTFIVHTECYQNFCTAVAGEFIHHYPVIHSEPDKQQIPTDLAYPNFLTDYKEMFGEEPPAQIWPSALAGPDWTGCNECGSACNHKCNA